MPQQPSEDVQSMIITHIKRSMLEAERKNDWARHEHELLRLQRERSEAVFQQHQQHNEAEKQRYDQLTRKRQEMEVMYQEEQNNRLKQINEYSVRAPAVSATHIPQSYDLAPKLTGQIGLNRTLPTPGLIQGSLPLSIEPHTGFYDQALLLRSRTNGNSRETSDEVPTAVRPPAVHAVHSTGHSGKTGVRMRERLGSGRPLRAMASKDATHNQAATLSGSSTSKVCKGKEVQHIPSNFPTPQQFDRSLLPPICSFLQPTFLPIT